MGEEVHTFANGAEYSYWDRCDECAKSVRRLGEPASYDIENVTCEIERALFYTPHTIEREVAIRGGWQEDTHGWRPCPEFVGKAEGENDG